MASPRRVVLIACGSYNPVTNMHLRMFGEWINIKKYTTDWTVVKSKVKYSVKILI